MATINMHDAKTQLSDLVARAEAGEEIFIARRNKPAVRLVRVRTRGEILPPVEMDPWEHAPDDYIHKDDIAAYYRRFPQEWDDMVERVGFGESEQASFDLTGLPAAVEQGREFTIMKDGKAIAKVVPVEADPKSRGWGAWEGRYRLPDSFFDPLPEDELRAWDGLDEPPA
ncbi:type II toxin-antitoxin system Phd/YefM family antitoxin [Mesorhizobium sp. IMUNJ 23232]|uniref:type II toxin-antitoxin system Phd/YefM family antitoxin n=1 Tax=Mesorhizobium sp. IMUNJ 23232 TaxID=3376064 RepID=UPI003799ABFD